MQIQLPFFSKPLCKECGKKPAYTKKGYCASCADAANPPCRECRERPAHTKDGLCRRCCEKGNRNHYFGKKHGETTREKISKNHADMSAAKNPRWKNGENIRGEKNPNWRHGASKRRYPSSFNRPLKWWIKERDGNQCMACHTTEQLTIHHINFDKADNDPANLITLCIRCNTRENRRFTQQARIEVWQMIQRWRGMYHRRAMEYFAEHPSEFHSNEPAILDWWRAMDNALNPSPNSRR